MKHLTQLLISVILLSGCGLNYGEKDYNYITGLRDKVKSDPTDQESLKLIIEQTEHPNLLSKVNAIAVLKQLSGDQSVRKIIYQDTLPVFVKALDHTDQGVVRNALGGLYALGSYAEPALGEIEKLFSSSDPIISSKAKEAYDRIQSLQKTEQSAGENAPRPTA